MRRRGITLIEMVLVIGLTSFLTAIMVRTYTMIQTARAEYAQQQNRCRALARLATDFRRDLRLSSDFDLRESGLRLINERGEVVADYDWGTPDDGYLERAPERYGLGPNAQIRIRTARSDQSVASDESDRSGALDQAKVAIRLSVIDRDGLLSTEPDGETVVLGFLGETP